MAEGRDEKGRFIKGWKGNKEAKGRPPADKNFADIYRQILDSSGYKLHLTVNGKTVTIERATSENIRFAIACKTIDEALKGEAWAIKEIIDRTDGKVKEKLEIEQKTSPFAVAINALAEAIIKDED